MTSLDQPSKSLVDARIGAAVRRCRESASLSEAQLARALSVPPSQIEAWENWCARIPADMLFRLSGLLKVPMASLVNLLVD